MGYTNSPVNGVPVPDRNEKLADIWKAEGILVKGIETRLVMVFSSMTDLTAKLVGDYAPRNGMVAYVSATDQFLAFKGGAWRVLSVGQPQVFTGSTTPSASQGAVGDIYYQY